MMEVANLGKNTEVIAKARIEIEALRMMVLKGAKAMDCLGNAQARVRGLHAQGREADAGETGHRCALNIAGPDISGESVHRGQWLVGEACGDATRRFDGRVKVLPGEARALGHWTPVHIHLGTASTTGRSLCSFTKAIIAAKSAGEPMVEPIRCSCFQNSLNRSTFSGGPAVAP